jgi:F-type H+-transporting ATPase subunit delta
VAARVTGISEIADRYAAALFQLADERKQLDEVASDLCDLRAMLADSADLNRLVFSPVISREDQGKAITAVLEKAGAGTLTRNFVGLVARSRRLFALVRMIESYLAELAKRRGEVTAQVTAASELSDDQTKALTEALRKMVGAKVAIDMRVDPGVLGGLVVKVGSRLFDSSLRTKLHKLALAMKGIS